MDSTGLKLGFGLMRLPKLADGSIDVPQVCTMADAFLAAGGRYFDTAYTYDGGRSEEAFREAVARRYPRDRYLLATKLSARVAASAEDARKQVYTSLARTEAGYFDYYLLHAIQRGNYKKFEEFGTWEFGKELKEKGLIRHLGFSFHADPELLDELLTKHPEIDFVQLQLNYADWENPGVAAHRNYDIVRRHGKLVTVMEPLKGGALAKPIPAVKAILDAAAPGVSYASWGIRYAASKEDVLIVLSGMSSQEQMEDNLRFMKDFRPMTEAELAVIVQAQEAMRQDKSIPCTGCRYCVDGCPAGIPIPDIFTVANNQKLFPGHDKGARDYAIVVEGKSKASACVGCGQCENACPQGLPIRKHLAEIAEILG